MSRLRSIRIYISVIFLSAALLSVLPFMARAQKQSSVQQQIKQAQAEIARIDKLVGQTKKEVDATEINLRLLETKIVNRRKIVDGLAEEKKSLSADIASRSLEVVRLGTRYADLKASYSALIRIAYKNYRNNSYLSFIFSARDFTDAARRLYYVKQIGLRTEQQGREISATHDRLAEELRGLETRQAELAVVEERQAAEIATLGREQEGLRAAEAKLRARTKELTDKAAENRRRLEQLQQELQRVVAEEVKARKQTINAPKSATGAKPSSSRTAAAPPPGRSVSDGSPASVAFAGRQGRLQLPVEGGVVVERFGTNMHGGAKMNNKGVNIAAREGAEVRCVWEGEVRKVFFFQGLGNSVIVRHGSYLTIYANLSQVFVREGERLIEGQSLGSLGSFGNNGQQSVLHFELWLENDTLNPEPWLALSGS